MKESVNKKSYHIPKYWKLQHIFLQGISHYIHQTDGKIHEYSIKSQQPQLWSYD